MKTSTLLLSITILFFIGCNAQKDNSGNKSDAGITKIENGQVIISNPELEYEVIIMDPGFERWFFANRKPKNYFDLNFLEMKNRRWVQVWNSRAMRGSDLIEYTIDYNAQTNYGYEVNYMLYHYLLYFQEANRIKLD